MIKRLFYGIVCAALLVSCGKDSDHAEIAMPDLLLLSGHVFEVSVEGGSFDVEINGTAECAVEVSSACRSWLSEQPASKAAGEVRTFRVRANTNGGIREGRIVFSSRTLKDTVYVVQAGTPDDAVLLVNRHRFEFPEEGGSFAVKVGSNADYRITIPAMCRLWLSETSTADDLATNNHRFTVAANRNYEAREGCIVFRNDGQADTVFVTQEATSEPEAPEVPEIPELSVFRLSGYEFELAGEGGIFSVEVESNVDYAVNILAGYQSWISELPATRTASSCIHRFQIEHNQSFQMRTGCITFGNDTLTSRVFVNQAAKFVWGEDFTEEIAPGVKIDMVYVEGGTFMMGDDKGYLDERPAHQVTLTDYYIGRYEVTQDLWEGITLKSQISSSIIGIGDNYPISGITWESIQEFIVRLNRITDKYYALPTEAQWEFAALGGNKSRGYTYSGSNNLDEVGWYYENSGNSTHPVGQKAPNELGIYDMSGNVSELCRDWYGDYTAEAQVNPTGPTEGTRRVDRGGGFSSSSGRWPKVKYRASSYSSGFRLVLPALN